MKCARCGGRVIWKGPIVNLTHTECLDCCAVNSQVDEQNEEQEENEDEDIDNEG